MKREENMKYCKQIILKLYFFQYLKNSNNIPSISKTIQHTPHDLVHVPAKFQENTSMHFGVSAKIKRDGWTDGRTGALQYLPSPGLRRRREIKTVEGEGMGYLKIWPKLWQYM